MSISLSPVCVSNVDIEHSEIIQMIALDPSTNVDASDLSKCIVILVEVHAEVM